ncbi:DUF262 domain-containing protein [Lachnospira eligens]|uniref:DUF262 domain-containing protein n=1 Tax=Clostridia TaxID=186801 RepID=UPI0016519669|nr:DUF262 domain-containing protein [Lachnospira eligens]
MIEEEFIVKPDQVDYTIGNIVGAIDKGYKLQKMENEKLDIEQRLEFSDSIIMKPDYQREYRSSIEEESSLIESILVGIPIPPVFLCSTRIKGAQSLNVVDGQHRLFAFYRFRKGKFALNNLCLLQKLEGLTFAELPEELQEKIVTHKLSTYVFRDFPGKKFELEIFNRYNKGTKTLTQQEIRNAVYSSPHNEYIGKFVKKLYESNEPLKDVYNVTKDRYLKKKVHEGIFSILYVLEFGINEEFKDSTTYANEYMRIKSEMVEKNTEEQVQEDLASSIKRFDQFNNWLLKCTKITPYPLSKEFYGIASKSYKFQTSMALILPALYKKIYDEKVLGDISFEKAIEMIQKAMLGSFIEDPHYTASSTNSKEIKKLVNSFGKGN